MLSLKLIFTTLINTVSLEQSHHKSMGKYGGGVLTDHITHQGGIFGTLFGSDSGLLGLCIRSVRTQKRYDNHK